MNSHHIDVLRTTARLRITVAAALLALVTLSVLSSGCGESLSSTSDPTITTMSMSQQAPVTSTLRTIAGYETLNERVQREQRENKVVNIAEAPAVQTTPTVATAVAPTTTPPLPTASTPTTTPVPVMPSAATSTPADQEGGPLVAAATVDEPSEQDSEEARYALRAAAKEYSEMIADALAQWLRQYELTSGPREALGALIPQLEQAAQGILAISVFGQPDEIKVVHRYLQLHVASAIEGARDRLSSGSSTLWLQSIGYLDSFRSGLASLKADGELRGHGMAGGVQTETLHRLTRYVGPPWLYLLGERVDEST